MTSQEKINVKNDIKKFETDTGRAFRTAHYWDRKKGFYSDKVTLADTT